MTLSIRSSVTLAIALPLIGGIALVAVASAWRTASDRLADLDEDLAARGAALASYVAFDGGFTVDFEGGPGPAPDVTSSLLGWRLTTEPDGDVLFEGGTLAVPDVSLAPASPDDLQRADWPRPWRLGDPALQTLDASPARAWTGRFLVRVEEGEVEMVRDRPTDLSSAPTVRVTLAEDLTPLRRDRNAHAALLALLGAGLSLGAIAMGALLSERITRPLEQLAADARAVRLPASPASIEVPHAGPEVQALARSLREAFARVQEAYTRQARFTADASHELRTPLTQIRTEAEVTLCVGTLDPTVREALEGIVEGADRMQSILEGLLLLARADADAPADRAPIEMLDRVRRVIDALPPDPTAPLPTVEGEACIVRAVPGQLDIVVRNLLNNARRHTPADGRITVRLVPDAANVRLVVTDTGEGIDPDELPHVFERFRVGDPSRQRGPVGSGLGLAIVAAVVGQHGGTVDVASVRDRGTTVTVTLPKA
ncbi:MAG: HAMP domain-containing histidine kinase [Alphaproteobacteria bacterium]|nr:HAMP domain-containing histidine kinase [Alphaproteobacteria bacterium]